MSTENLCEFQFLCLTQFQILIWQPVKKGGLIREGAAIRKNTVYTRTHPRARMISIKQRSPHDERLQKTHLHMHTHTRPHALTRGHTHMNVRPKLRRRGRQMLMTRYSHTQNCRKMNVVAADFVRKCLTFYDMSLFVSSEICPKVVVFNQNVSLNSVQQSKLYPYCSQ